MKENFNTKISVIIPIYNSDIFLKKCLNSIVNQSYNNLEIILINDGSTDGSAKIIDEYAARDKRIVTIHKENGGIGSAYRIAFLKMTGDYVSFVDSDDYIEPNMYEELVKIVEEKKPDIVHFGITTFNDKGAVVNCLKTLDETIDGTDNILKIHFEQLKHPTLARLFKKSLLDNIKLFDQNIGIDEMLIVQILLKSNKAVFTSKSFYHVTPRSDSVSRIQYSKKKIVEGIMVHRFICNFMDKYNIRYSHHLSIKYLKYLILVLNLIIKNKEFNGSQELSCIKNDLANFYQKVKGSYEYDREPLMFKLKIKTIVLYPFLFRYLTSLIFYCKMIKTNAKQLLNVAGNIL